MVGHLHREIIYLQRIKDNSSLICSLDVAWRVASLGWTQQTTSEKQDATNTDFGKQLFREHV
jgi:hypothetical protein